VGLNGLIPAGGAVYEAGFFGGDAEGYSLGRIDFTHDYDFLVGYARPQLFYIPALGETPDTVLSRPYDPQQVVSFTANDPSSYVYASASSYFYQGVYVDGGTGKDDLYGGLGDDYLYGGDGDFTDNLYGSYGDHVGPELAVGYQGANYMDGGDTLNLSANGAVAGDLMSARAYSFRNHYRKSSFSRSILLRNRAKKHMKTALRRPTQLVHGGAQ
jgi:hypothetical protein